MTILEAGYPLRLVLGAEMVLTGLLVLLIFVFVSNKGLNIFVTTYSRYIVTTCTSVGV